MDGWTSDIMVEVGDTAPDFEMADTNGDTVKLEMLRGSKVLLYFYPKDNTPGCTKEACSLRDHYGELQAQGVKVLGVSADGMKAHQKFTNKYELNFPLLTDEDWETAKAYGSFGPKKLYGKLYDGVYRHSYLIDEEGKVAHVWKKVKTSTHGADVLEHIQSSA